VARAVELEPRPVGAQVERRLAFDAVGLEQLLEMAEVHAEVASAVVDVGPQPRGSLLAAEPATSDEQQQQLAHALTTEVGVGDRLVVAIERERARATPIRNRDDGTDGGVAQQRPRRLAHGRARGG